MKNERKSGELLQTAYLFAVVVLAFIAALCFRRSAGILAMTPIMLVLAGIAAFIPFNTALKCVIFGVTVFVFNTMECDDTSVAVTYAALCILTVLLFCIAATFIKRKKLYGFFIFAAGTALSVILCFIYVGNPITAYNARNTLNGYAELHYPERENAYLGNFEFSDIYYRYDTKAYCIDAVSDKFPTESATLSLGDTVVCDGFKSIMVEKITQPYIAELSSILRSSFPEASFDVSFDKFATYPDFAVLSAQKDELHQNICYEVYIGGVQTAEQMRETVTAYQNAIDESGIGYARIIFKSGIGNWQKRYVAINANHPPYYPCTKVKYVNTASSNLLNEYFFQAFYED